MSASFEQKICPPQQLAARLASCARPLVFTNGVFDILHRGQAPALDDRPAQEDPRTLIPVHFPARFSAGGQSFSSLPGKPCRSSLNLEASASGTSRTVK